MVRGTLKFVNKEGKTYDGRHREGRIWNFIMDIPAHLFLAVTNPQPLLLEADPVASHPMPVAWKGECSPGNGPSLSMIFRQK